MTKFLKLKEMTIGSVFKLEHADEALFRRERNVFTSPERVKFQSDDLKYVVLNYSELVILINSFQYSFDATSILYPASTYFTIFIPRLGLFTWIGDFNQEYPIVHLAGT